MQDYVLIVIVTIVGFICLGLLFFFCFFLIQHYRNKQQKRPERTTSRVYPRISSPIYAISNTSIDKKSNAPGDTLRKLSMFDRKKPTAFSAKSLYYGHEPSPRVAHKEYLDFNAIDAILPKMDDPQRVNRRNDNSSYYESQSQRSVHHLSERTVRRHDEREQRSFDSDETTSTQMSREMTYADEQPHRGPGRISVIEERPFGGNSSLQYAPVEEIYRENHVSYHRDN